MRKCCLFFDAEIALADLLAGTLALHVIGLCMIARLKRQDVRPKQISKFAGMRVRPQSAHLKYVAASLTTAKKLQKHLC